MATVNLLSLASVEDHPRLVQARASLANARDALTAADAKRESADADVHDAESDAALGRRDEKRLRTTREHAAHWQSEARIAKHRVEHLTENLTHVFAALCEDAERELRTAHEAAVDRLADALSTARQRSHEVAAIELASERLFAGGPYRQHDGLPGQPLLRLAWWKEFGGPESTMETRYGFWRALVEDQRQKA